MNRLVYVVAPLALALGVVGCEKKDAPAGTGSKSVVDAAKDATKKTTDAVKDTGAKAADAVKDTGAKAADAVKDTAAGAADAAKKALGDAVASFDGPMKTAKDGYEAIKAKLASASPELKAKLEPVIKTLGDQWTSIEAKFTELKSGKGDLTKLTGEVKDLLGKFTDGVKKAGELK
jgi:hypothetical protein